jgi:two-component system sensor histidine kinase DegS
MRITQEAVNNALAHAGAQKVCVVLEGTPERLSILVDDDGRGFDATQSYRGRFGLSGQRERAHKIGAQLHFTSRPGRGTRMILCVPARNTPHYALSQ